MFRLFLLLSFCSLSVLTGAQTPITIDRDIEWINFMFKDKMGKDFHVAIQGDELTWDDGTQLRMPLKELVVKVDEDKQRFYIDCQHGDCINATSKSGKSLPAKAHYVFQLKRMKVGNSNQTYFFGMNLRRAASMALGERPEDGKMQQLTDREKQHRPVSELIGEELAYLNQHLKIVEGKDPKILKLEGKALYFDGYYGTAKVPADKVLATMSTNEKEVNLRCEDGTVCIEFSRAGVPTDQKSELNMFQQPYSGAVAIPESYSFARRLNRVLKLQVSLQKGVETTSLADMEKATNKELSSRDKEDQVRELCMKLQGKMLAGMNLLPAIVDDKLVHWQRRDKIKTAAEAVATVTETLNEARKILGEMEEAAKTLNNTVKADEARRASNILSLSQNQMNLASSMLASINRYEEYSKERIKSIEKDGKSYYATGAEHVRTAYAVITEKLEAANKTPAKNITYASAEERGSAVDLETSRLVIIGYSMNQMQTALSHPELLNAMKAIPDQKKVCVHLEFLRKQITEHYIDLDTAMQFAASGIVAAQKLGQSNLVNSYQVIQKDLMTIKKNLDETMKLLYNKSKLESMSAEELLLLVYTMKPIMDNAQNMVFDMNQKVPEFYIPKR